MDFHRAADIINMDLTGRDPGPLTRSRNVHPSQPSHVRLIGDDELIDAWYQSQVANEPDTQTLEDALGNCWEVFPDRYDDSTYQGEQYEVTIHFDAETPLEAQLVVDSLRAFARRRLLGSKITDCRITFTNNNPNT